MKRRSVQSYDAKDVAQRLLPQAYCLFLNTRSSDDSRGESNSSCTCATPDSTMPRTLAAARETSMIRPFSKGPRSFIRTSTDFPLARLVSFTMLPHGRLRCAAVNFFWSKTSPLAVRFPWCFFPYHEARPASTIVGGEDAGNVARGEVSRVAGEMGMMAADGLSSGGVSVCTWSMGGFSLRLSGGDIALLETD